MNSEEGEFGSECSYEAAFVSAANKAKANSTDSEAQQTARMVNSLRASYIEDEDFAAMDITTVTQKVTDNPAIVPCLVAYYKRESYAVCPPDHGDQQVQKQVQNIFDNLLSSVFVLDKNDDDDDDGQDPNDPKHAEDIFDHLLACARKHSPCPTEGELERYKVAVHDPMIRYMCTARLPNDPDPNAEVGRDDDSEESDDPDPLALALHANAPVFQFNIGKST